MTYATVGLGWDMRKKIIDFNKSNDKYRIEIRDYSQLNTGDDNAAGLTRLNLDMAAGNGPDILDMGTLPIRQYGAKGLLEDLWPYIEKDSDIGRERLMEKVLRAAQQNGKLYQSMGSFVDWRSPSGSRCCSMIRSLSCAAIWNRGDSGWENHY